AHALLFTEPAARERSSIRDPAYDRTAEKMLEQQIGELRRLADKTGADHEEFLKRIGHDLRTPLTAIVGFAEAILSENFGPIGNERYRDYLGGIRNAAERILALIEAFDREPQSETKSDKPAVAKESTVDLNTIVQSCVSELQPEASRERVLIRTSLARPLPSVAADMNAVRQIVLNLMTNSIKLAGAGGQVIISTGVSGAGSVSLRLRDTGIGVNENDVAAALGTASMEKAADGSEGRLKLAVAKALVEANRASLKISSRPNDGTLVEVSFRETMPPPAA
ncbi:MAG TPA: HAMP domain-containing sensor histidine kinase, partial [Xanthobacteraceae bacterium]|nr:HAMP domain-containing sensor histidine kinase [Xanthobacteraceae bacterium]